MNQRSTDKDPDAVEVDGLINDGTVRSPGQESKLCTRVSIRTATPSDAEGLRRMFSRVSTETIYLRFHIPYPHVPEQMLTYMLGADGRYKQSFVAVAEGEIVGHTMYARLGDGAEAEMAILVEDGWQSKGVGKLLLSNLAEDARRRGVEAFVGTTLLENRRMLGLVGAVFAGSKHEIAGGALRFRAPLMSPKPEDPVQILRHAA